MLNMSDINDIKELAVKGYRISEIHEKTGIDRKTIRKYLLKEDFSEMPPTSVGRPSVLDPFKPIIDQWIKENDKLTWSKQHHTAQRMYDRLRKEAGYTGSYDTVRKYIAKIRKDIQNKASQELIWEPGYTEVDFSEADFFENNVQVRRKYLVLSFPYSNYAFVQLFGGETAECVCQGLRDIFEEIGGVPKVLVFDNATGVGHRVHDKVVETSMFQRFRARYRFSVRFCNPESGWEKGCVENKVGDIRRNHFVPMPHYEDIMDARNNIPCPVVIHPETFSARYNVSPHGFLFPHITAGFPSRKECEDAGAKFIVVDEPMKVGPGAMTTGEIPWREDVPFEPAPITIYHEQNHKFIKDKTPDEMAVCVNLKDHGLIVFSGCAHNGIINTVKRCQEVSGVDKVYAVIGGFHLGFPEVPRQMTSQTIEKMKEIAPEVIIPQHCTGFRATAEIMNAFPEEYVQTSAGMKVCMPFAKHQNK